MVQRPRGRERRRARGREGPHPLADAAGFSPDDVKRHAREFGERLTSQRREIERSIDDAVRRAANRFRIPTQDDLEALQKRLDAISERLDALAREKRRRSRPSARTPRPGARWEPGSPSPRGRWSWVSRATADEQRPALPAQSVAADAGRARRPLRRGCLVERVAIGSPLRMPVLDDDDRERLARTIVLEANAARIDPLLVLALIEVESRYDPEALSERGARSGSCSSASRPCAARSSGTGSTDDLDDPVANVQAGIRYLRRLLDAFGREEVALMAYNAGPNRILGYLREGEIPRALPGATRGTSAPRSAGCAAASGQERAPAVAETAPAPAPVGG